MPSEVTRREFLSAAGTVAAGATAGAVIGATSASAAEAATGKPLKIVGICCSPRKGKTTSTALRACLAAAKAVDPRIEIELIELGGMKIPGEVAAGVALEPGERDDFPQVAAKLNEPGLAGIILGTPVYFGNMSSLCKAFIDRCIVFHKDKLLSNKVGGVVAVGGAERRAGIDRPVGPGFLDVAADDRSGRRRADRPLGRNRVGRRRRNQSRRRQRHYARRDGHGHRKEPRPPRGRSGPAAGATIGRIIGGIGVPVPAAVEKAASQPLHPADTGIK